MKFKERFDLENYLVDKGLDYKKIRDILSKAKFDRHWHEAPPMVMGYHTRYSLKKHFEGMGKETKYGFELEVEYRGQDGAQAHEKAPLIHDLANRTIGKGLIRMETDGSLSNGLEIITAPLSESELRLRYSKLHQFLRGLKKIGFTSHDPGSCGLHIHISRPEEKVIGKIENLLLKNENTKTFWREMSRRGDRTNYSEFKRQKSNARSKYFALNKMNQNTIEMRLFRGTLNPGSFFASLESVFALVNFTTSAKNGSWRQFHSFVMKGRYKYFTDFVKNYMGDNWRVPPKTPRIILSAEERLIRDRQQQEAREHNKRIRYERLQRDLKMWLRSINDAAQNTYERAEARLTYDLQPCQIVCTRGTKRRELRFSNFVTPISFRPVAKERYDLNNRPIVVIRRNRRNRWGSNTSAELTRVSRREMWNFQGNCLGSIPRERFAPIFDIGANLSIQNGQWVVTNPNDPMNALERA